MTYRKLHTKTWQDSWFEGLGPESKLLFLYCITNESCTQAGIYQITPARIQFETGIKEPNFDELEAKVYHNSDGVVWVKSFFKYQCQNRSFAEAALEIVREGFPFLLQDWVAYNQFTLEKYHVESVPSHHGSSTFHPAPTNPPPRTTEQLRAASEAEKKSEAEAALHEGEEKTFSLPSLDKIKNASSPVIDKDIKNTICALESIGIFPEANSFADKQLKAGKNHRALLHALVQCHKERPANPEAYATKIIKAENGNYNEAEHTKQNFSL